MRAARLGLGVVALLGLVATAQTPAPQPPQPPQPTFRTEANYVRVDVLPTRDGTPVDDLTQADFEVLEGGTPQSIEQFEHIVIRAAGPQDTRIEPNTIRESRAMAESSRARLFVVFLDTYHVDVGASHNIRKPLVDSLDRVIGADDLVAVMTPEMSARDIAFGRKTTTIDGFLTRYWHWGERDRMIPPDAEDEAYGLCYPNAPPPLPNEPDCRDQNGIAAEMIDRRHEKRAIDALRDLVAVLRGVREERKAILAITNGWLLYRTDRTLMRPLTCHGVPTGPAVTVDPRNGRLTTKEPFYAVPSAKCDADRMNLAQIDDDQDFRTLLDEANRANASFYPVDPRGLAAFDTPIVRTDVPGPLPRMTTLTTDRAMLAGRLTSLRTLAEATDGLAIVDSNDLAGGLARVVSDLSSYYLLGYYSTGKLDGKFHPISVRVKRPGVQVRARRGYLAATPGATAAATAAAAAASVGADEEALAIASALAPLANVTREVPVRLAAASGWKPEQTAVVAVVGELTGDVWKSGANADVSLAPAAGDAIATAHATVTAGTRSFRVTLTAMAPLPAGDYIVRVRARDAASATVVNESLQIRLPASPFAAGVLWLRRGLSTRNQEVPTADPRFRRNEQVRVEVPAPERGSVAARLLDRAGHALAVPVTAVTRDDGDGSRWQTAQLALAPLAPGDYVIELSGGNRRTLAAFRVVP